MIDAGLLVLRSVTGGLLAGHGAQKLFGAFEGPGPEGTTGMMGAIGMQPPGLWARVAGASEFVGGTLTALGLGGPVGPVTALGPMTIAATTVHWGKPIWVTRGGAELPVIDAAAFGALALTGPGRLSVDGLLGIRVPRWVGAFAAVGVAGGAVAVHLMRRQPAQQPQPQEPPGPPQYEDREIELTATPERPTSVVEAATQQPQRS
jgi:putative oxidoreductase